MPGMDLLHILPWFWLCLAVHLVGLLSAALARFAEGSLRQPIAQRFFFLCLLLATATSLLALVTRCEHWPICAGSLGTMALTATLDLRRPGTHSPAHAI